MATTEHARHQLYRRLIDTIGPDEADTLMEFLPPSGWAEVTTKTDLAHHTEATNARIDALAVRTDARFDRLEDTIRNRAQIFDARLGTEIADVRVELGDLRTELHRSLRLHTLVTIAVLGTLITVMSGITTGL